MIKGYQMSVCVAACTGKVEENFSILERKNGVVGVEEGWNLRNIILEHVL
jgi:hypothetical protein